jgi:hypothetical protein
MTLILSDEEADDLIEAIGIAYVETVGMAYHSEEDEFAKRVKALLERVKAHR